MFTCGEIKRRGQSNLNLLDETTMELDNDNCIGDVQINPDKGKSDMKHIPLFLLLPPPVMMMIMMQYNGRPVINEFIMENFTTSICREWSNYIYLSDRATVA